MNYKNKMHQMPAFLLGLAFAFCSVSAVAQQAATMSYNATDNVIEASMDATNTMPFGQFKTDGACATAGQMDYDTVNNRFEFCNGTNWIIADCEVPTGAGACVAAGEMRFNTSKNVYEFCNGTEYRYLMCPVSWVSGFTLSNTATDGKLSISSDATQHWSTLDISDLIGTALVTSVAYGNDVWVGRTSDNDIIYSSDGLTWAKTTDTDITGTVQNITFSSGYFVTRATNNIVSSTDGINWSVVSALSFGTNFIDLGNSTWIGFHGAEVYQSTDDGANWTKTLDRGGTSEDMLPQPIYVNGTLYGVDRDNDYSSYSFDHGATWVSNTTVLSNQLAIGAHGRIYIWNGNARYAEDGSTTTWTSGAGITSNSSYGKMGIGNGVAVATNYSGTRYISTDEDLGSWTSLGTHPRRETTFAYGGSHNDPGNLPFASQMQSSLEETVTSGSITVDTGATRILKVYAGNGAEVEKNATGAWVAGDGTLTVTGGDTLKVRMAVPTTINTEKVSTVQVGTSTVHWSLGIERSRRVPVVIQSSQVSATVTDFPLLLTEDTLPSEMFDSDGSYPAQNGGGDIIITSDAAGATILPIEIVNFTTNANPALGTAEIWVKVPSVDGSADTTLYVWYNSSSTNAQPAVTSTYGRNTVWSDYELVVHANSATPVDSTGKSTVTVNGTLSEVTGPFGTGLDFGSGEYLNITGNATLTDLPENAPFGITFWAKRSTWSNGGAADYATAFAWGGTDDLLLYPYEFVSVNRTRVFWRDASLARPITNNSNLTTPMTIGTWNKFALGMADSDQRLYINNELGADNGANTGSLAAAGPFNSFRIGGWADSSQDFRGEISEIRVGLDRDLDWNITEYNNQNSPSTFVIEGTPVAAP